MTSRARLAHAVVGVLIFAGHVARAESYVATTLAGQPSIGYADGPGATARFALPEAIARGPDGALYVADYDNGVIRKVTPAGVVTTVAGVLRAMGYVDGAAASAQFLSVFGIAVDAAGTIYVSDASAATIRRIAGGNVTTFAGKPGETGNVDGPATTARFGDPRGLAVDGAGNVYVGDIGNCTVRKITPDGVVSTIAGSGAAGSSDGAGAAASFGSPYGVAVDRSGNVYVTDWVNSTVRRITPGGVVTTLAGVAGVYGSTNGTGSAARFDAPCGIAVDPANNVYVSDRVSDVVRMISPDGLVTTIAGDPYMRGYRDGVTNTARFHAPSGLAVDPAGYLYIADTYNCTLRRMTTAGSVTTIAGQSGGGQGDGLRATARFFSPESIISDGNGTFYIADTYNHTVRKMAANGLVSTVAGMAGAQGSIDGTAADARFRYPQSLALDAAGNLFVSDFGNDTIRKVTPGGVVGTFAGLARNPGADDGTGTAARFRSPADIKLGPDGNLVVADSRNHTLRRITPNGTVTTLAGAAGIPGTADGPARAARFNSPWGLAFDRHGTLYVADAGNHVVRKVTPDGTVTTLAGLAGVAGFLDGTRGAARFAAPGAVAVDEDGNVFVSDTANHALRRVTPDGTATTIGGSGYPDHSDGLGDAAQFFYPGGMVVDHGALYVADEVNHSIRRLSLAAITATTSRLFNLSVRANLLSDTPLLAGFVASGAPKPILVRAIGPGLAPFVGGATELAADPRIELYDGALNLVQANDDWDNTPATRAAFASVGAFPLSPGSKDAVVLRELSGVQTVQVTTHQAGLALVEAYDAGEGTTSRLINVSARYRMSSGDSGLFAGFVIAGTGSKTVLIRGVGPTLASFGVTGALANPVLTLYAVRDGTQLKIAGNDDWAPSLGSTFSAVNAFQLVSGSKDAAILISLTPGLYTAQLGDAGGAAGDGMIEVYEVGN